jgi:putative PEP-CTERM system histidine kinase
MTFFAYLPFVAGLFSLLLAVISWIRRKPSSAAWSFSAGMAVLGLESLFTGFSLRATAAPQILTWLTRAFIVKSLAPAIWLWFSVTYSRGDFRERVARWRLPLTLFGLAPVVIAVLLRDRIFQLVAIEAPQLWALQVGVIGKALNGVLLIQLVVILMNLEQTFRSAVGTMRWRIKFVMLALAVMFIARVYVRSQVILFSAPDLALWSVESGSLLIGCLLLTLAYARTGLAEIEVYPSLAVVRSSLTVLIAGAYLVLVGVLAQVVKRFGGAEIFHFQAFVVLAGMTGLAVLLLSDRARLRLQRFVARHFRKAQHDSARIWTLFSQRLASVRGEADLCAASARLVSDTFDALSVTMWVVDEGTALLTVKASTGRDITDATAGTASGAVVAALSSRSPFDLEDIDEPWAEELRQLNPTLFPNGGRRVCVPLRAGEQTLGAIVLTDRVSGTVYTVEEIELLKCVGDQVASVLMNLRLASEVARGRELEAFRTMSAFFVHDLKNAASSLNLMLKNLPVHFDDPAFRQDALRAVGNTAGRIDRMIARLSAFRQRPDLTRIEADLNQLVEEALQHVDAAPSIEVTTDLQPVPTIVADRDQIQSVVTNLVLNARDATGSGGHIHVSTEHRGARVVLSVADSGSGMTPAFVHDSLFRPFQSTKKNGLGIGLFQSRAIVHAHGGAMHVESEVGKGTTFLVTLPAKGPQ